MSEKYKRKNSNDKKTVKGTINTERMLNLYQKDLKTKNFLLDYVFKTQNEQFFSVKNTGNNEQRKELTDSKKDTWEYSTDNNKNNHQTPLLSPNNSNSNNHLKKNDKMTPRPTFLNSINLTNVKKPTLRQAINLNVQFSDMAKKIKQNRNNNKNAISTIKMNDTNTVTNQCLTEASNHNNYLLTGSDINSECTLTSPSVKRNTASKHSMKNVSFINSKIKNKVTLKTSDLNLKNNPGISKDNINFYEVNIGKYMNFTNKDQMVYVDMNNVNNSNSVFNLNKSTDFKKNSNKSVKFNTSMKDSFSHLMNFLNVDSPEELHFASVLFYQNKKKVSEKFDREKTNSNENKDKKRQLKDFSKSCVILENEVIFETEC